MPVHEPELPDTLPVTLPVNAPYILITGRADSPIDVIAVVPELEIDVTPERAPDEIVTALIVLDVAALIPPDVVSVVPLNVNVPAVAPFIVV